MHHHDGKTTLAAKVYALRQPQTYPDLCASIKAIETHFAWVFLAGDYAYKMKKPMQMERMNFRDLGAREHNCREELRLNRRLAPKVYLDVLPLCINRDGQLHVNGHGVTIEWLVKMRRLPAARLLNEALLAHTVTAAEIQPIAARLAEFYRDQVPVLFSSADYLSRLHAHVDDTREQLLAVDLRLNSNSIEQAIEQQRSFLFEHSLLIQERVLAGKIIEGHGDLRPEHIFLGSESSDVIQLSPCIIDCLEFDGDLRIFDPVEELAFLALECERLDAAWAGVEFLNAYRAIALDAFDTMLFDFYRTERALNRAKITAWHVRDPEARGLADWVGLANSYLRDALDTSQVRN